MLISEIASLMNVGAANQLELEQALIIIDAVQKNAFARDLDAFLVYDQPLVIELEMAFTVDYYAPFVPEELGDTLTGAVSGATAKLVRYDNATRRCWAIPLAGEFQREFVTSAHAVRSLVSEPPAMRGPYAAPQGPDAPPCRKVWGITPRRPGRFHYMASSGSVADYGAAVSSHRPFVAGMVNDLEQTFTFATAPSLAAELYWVYWRGAPDITSDDPSRLLIPAAYHMQLVSCCRVAAEAILGGRPVDQGTVDTFLGGWYASLQAPFRDQDGWQNMTQDGGHIGVGLV